MTMTDQLTVLVTKDPASGQQQLQVTGASGKNMSRNPACFNLRQKSFRPSTKLRRLVGERRPVSRNMCGDFGPAERVQCTSADEGSRGDTDHRRRWLVSGEVKRRKSPAVQTSHESRARNDSGQA